ncbi:MAG: HAMP domain-containing methyl-accepting chemotaxis protein [Alphaproteobacteria bacterium]
MTKLIDFKKLSTKFFGATVLLFAIAGIVIVVMSTRSLDRLSAIIGEVDTLLSRESAALQSAHAERLKAEQARDRAVITAENAKELAARQQQIAVREAELQGYYQGALRIVASQLESILSPMSKSDREFFILDGSVFLAVLEGANSIGFYPISDLDGLADLADTEGFAPARVKTFEKVISDNLGVETPFLAIDREAGLIRIAALIGPTAERFGLIEVILQDRLTPMKTEARELATSYAAKLSEQSAEQDRQFQARLAELDAQRKAGEEERARQEARTADEERSARRLLITAVVLSSLFGAVAISVLVVKLITRPLGRNVAIMSRLAGNDTDVEVSDAHRTDEIGEMAQAVQVFKDSLIAAEQQAEERRAERAAREARVQKIEAMAKEFDAQVSGSLDNVSTATRDMRATSEQMSGVAQQTADQTKLVTQASETAAESVQTVATAADELSKSNTEIAEQAATSSQVSEAAADQARMTDERVRRLNDAAQKIGEVIQLITDIAEQTNLLALNATIEAARAGDAGKGFAVVASEVKNLANQTAKATEEIAAQVANIQSETGDTVRAIAKISESVDRMCEIAAGISAAVEQQSAATQEIARNTDEATTGTRRASDSTAQVAKAAAETEQSAAEVLKSVDTLDREGDRLRRYVTEFLDQVRAA